MIKLVRDGWQVGGFHRALRFHPPIEMTAMYMYQEKSTDFLQGTGKFYTHILYRVYLVTSVNRTDRHDIIKVLLKMAINIHNSILQQNVCSMVFFLIVFYMFVLKF